MYEEPPFQSGDTRPTMTVPVLEDEERTGGPRVLGILSLVGAVLFAVATIALLVAGGDTGAPEAIDDGNQVVDLLPTASPTGEPLATAEPVEGATAEPQIVFVAADALPTVDSSLLVSLLDAPPAPADTGNPYVISREAISPFTVIPDRPRNEVIEYTIQRGDTVSDIAMRFGLEQDSIAWANDQQKLWTLVPGQTLLIPPVDGVIHIAAGDDTVAEITSLYGISDPYAIIDTEYNQLKGYTPDMNLPSGMRVFVPGGTGLYVDWAPPLVIGTGTASGVNSVGSNLVQFPAGPGACPPQEPGPSSGWVRPLSHYTITLGFTDWHQGIDLGAAEGTPVMAANTGRVIFAGWSTWGYGYAVVLSHGSYTSLYGHLSAYNVRCGQIVSAGQNIGAVGSTGNSSGPHLHFEILYGFTRGNPAATIGF